MRGEDHASSAAIGLLSADLTPSDLTRGADAGKDSKRSGRNLISIDGRG